ncbi:nucleoside deaminase [Methylobacterium isbiliense]|uniref:Guanine deaminase n=1 Tax=Methylobacterium isbiliense TaxID=315478 RepID=A0ABQ4S6N9_9HYPH|nr:nucleoside deaminase [Methylobacterium isbiliense]MDN3622940.1 nucleoside deaminase [Methylobacterium isbiliense]GJD98810.1 Guanine deaminase [Methylobacterium isbiliense]
MTEDDRRFMARAIALSETTALVERAGGPFGCVIVQDGRILAEGANRVAAENDPTWHAEMEAIRNACRAAGKPKLDEATLYTSAEPCAMCLAAACWAGIARIVYASTNADAAAAGFDAAWVAEALCRPASAHRIPARQLMRAEAVEVWNAYRAASG